MPRKAVHSVDIAPEWNKLFFVKPDTLYS